MYPEQAKILVVDDEASVTDLLSDDLGEEGYNCDAAATGEDTLRRLSRGNFDVMLLDLKLPGISGIEVLEEMTSNCPETAVIVVTGVEDVKTAVEAMKLGAVDYITKPFELERVNESVEAALEVTAVQKIEPIAKGEGVKTMGEEADWKRYIDDIASGVERSLDSLTGHVMTKTVIERTISISRSLDIPE
ncbi:response regulator [Chloroflexota bacterium]